MVITSMLSFPCYVTGNGIKYSFNEADLIARNNY